MHLIVHADQRQFSVRDEGFRLTGRGWTDLAVTSHRIAPESRGMAIATARSDLVEVSVSVLDAAPAVSGAAHVVEADLVAESGTLVISGPSDYPSQEKRVAVEPGRYRVRVSYVPSGPPPTPDWNDFEYGEHFRYELALWPTTSPEEVKVLRQGASVWDG